MTRPMIRARVRSTCLLALACMATSSLAGPLFAAGQRLTAAVPGVHDDIRENFLYRIELDTGVATPVSPATSGLPPALGGTPDALFGYRSRSLGTVDPTTGAFTAIASGGPSATNLDLLADGRAYIVPFDAASHTQQLHGFDVGSLGWLPLGSATSTGDAIDLARGTPAGTAEPFIISLGSVGDALFGIDLDSGSLIRFEPDTGAASVVGEVGAVTAGTAADYSGFAALSGADTDDDGDFDALFGVANFLSVAGGPTQRLGGIIRFDLDDGTWDLVGTNPGVIFFGMGAQPSRVDGPSTLALALFGIGLGMFGRRRHLATWQR